MDNYNKYLTKINNIINTYIGNNYNDDIKEKILYALEGGKRLRSIIPLVISSKLNNSNLHNLAISIELLHNASLIIDDMPCMDNDRLRRNKLSIHAKYGLRTAQLLVNLLLEISFDLIYENINNIKNQNIYGLDYFNKINLYILKNVNYNLGLMGACGGQFIDTCPINKYVNNKDFLKEYKNIDKLLDLIYLKTTTFFEISFISSYLLSGGNFNNIDKLKKAVKYFGLAFQISDDFEDIEQDIIRNKDNYYNPNLVCKYGKTKASEVYNESKKKFFIILDTLKINDDVFLEIFQYLDKRIK